MNINDFSEAERKILRVAYKVRLKVGDFYPADAGLDKAEAEEALMEDALNSLISKGAACLNPSDKTAYDFNITIDGSGNLSDQKEYK